MGKMWIPLLSAIISYVLPIRKWGGGEGFCGSDREDLLRQLVIQGRLSRVLKIKKKRVKDVLPETFMTRLHDFLLCTVFYLNINLAVQYVYHYCT